MKTTHILVFLTVAFVSLPGAAQNLSPNCRAVHLAASDAMKYESDKHQSARDLIDDTVSQVRNSCYSALRTIDTTLVPPLPGMGWFSVFLNNIILNQVQKACDEQMQKVYQMQMKANPASLLPPSLRNIAGVESGLQVVWNTPISGASGSAGSSPQPAAPNPPQYAQPAPPQQPVTPPTVPSPQSCQDGAAGLLCRMNPFR